jgi:hypothetical protein
MELRILYVGHSGSMRERVFVGFLGKHFRRIGTADLARFRPSQTAGFDVMIFDYPGDASKAPRVRLPKSYARPTVTVGEVGAGICGHHGLKTDYL